ncbi:dTDP-4-dehydrorhamnose 3,5-epimerase family protein [Pseudomonas sp.]|uniref:dTDP-4-dehydrorhamnose 3,5-epimerase family protein n=1 Tax=Pseudomonas sp. TaxID=306 RepID=UPI0034590C29
MTYLVSAPYTPTAEWGVRFSDPLFDIQWPLPVSNISDKDAGWPLYDVNAEPFFR